MPAGSILLGKRDLARSIADFVVVDVGVYKNLFANVIKKSRYPRVFSRFLYLSTKFTHDHQVEMITGDESTREKEGERERGGVGCEKGSDLTISRQ